MGAKVGKNKGQIWSIRVGQLRRHHFGLSQVAKNRQFVACDEGVSPGPGSRPMFGKRYATICCFAPLGKMNTDLFPSKPRENNETNILISANGSMAPLFGRNAFSRGGHQLGVSPFWASPVGVRILSQRPNKTGSAILARNSGETRGFDFHLLPLDKSAKICAARSIPFKTNRGE